MLLTCIIFLAVAQCSLQAMREPMRSVRTFLPSEASRVGRIDTSVMVIEKHISAKYLFVDLWIAVLR